MSEENGRGQPTKYKPEYCAMLIEHMKAGYGYVTFAVKIGVHHSIMYDWEKVHEEWAIAKEMAFNACQLFWEKLGIDHVVSVSESEKSGDYQHSSSKSLNSTVWTFNMKNRFGWRDKQPDEVDTIVNNNNSNVNNVSSISDDELNKKIEALQMKLFGDDQ